MAQAKSYSFSSVGTKKSAYDAVVAATVITPPIGIKTPLEMGDNADGIFNDDVYEYESLGYPFLAALGRSVWQVLNAKSD